MQAASTAWQCDARQDKAILLVEGLTFLKAMSPIEGISAQAGIDHHLQNILLAKTHWYVKGIRLI